MSDANCGDKSWIFSKDLLRRIFFLLAMMSFTVTACRTTATNNNNSNAMGAHSGASVADNAEIFLWSWERADDFDFLKTLPNRRIGVAFYAQTLFLKDENVIWKPRRQSLKIPDGVKRIAVTRIETTTAGTRVAPKFTAEQINKIVEFIVRTAQLKDVSEVQIDFDALESERENYREIVHKVRAKLPAALPLSITALASWCIGEQWLQDLPVSEAVPMLFRLGKTDDAVKTYLTAGKDFTQPLCRKSYGISTDENFVLDFQSGRRIYFFKDGKGNWRTDDLKKLERFRR